MKDDNQKKKIIVLGCLIVFAIVVGLRGLSSKGTSAGPRAAKPSVAQEVNNDAKEDDVILGQEGIITGMGVAGVGRDPFAPQVAKETAIPKTVTTPANRRNVPLIAQEPIPPFPLVGPSSMQPDGGNVTLNLVENPAEKLRLTGVIEGAVKVAIIRGEGNTRYIVREGQTVDGEYFVEKITRGGVRLKSKTNQSFVLQLGGNNAIDDETRA